jgi:hypothetical protein
MIRAAMARTCLIWSLCIALVLLGASGLHGHVAQLGVHATSPHAHTHEHEDSAPAPYAQVITVFDAEHFHGHEHHGDIDIDPVTKAFGKGPVMQMFAALLFVCGILWLLNAPQFVFRTALPPLRPPRIRFRPHLLPPSQAPPHAA